MKSFAKRIALILAIVMTAAIICLPLSAAEYTPKTAKAVKATAIIDGEMEDIWKETDKLEADQVNKTIIYNPEYESNTVATVRLLWDDRYLYVYAEVLDSELYYERTGAQFIPDGIEIQVDEENNKTGTLNVQGSLNGRQANPAAGSYQVFADNTMSGFGDQFEAGKAKFRYAVIRNGAGYNAEMAIPWNTLTPEVGTQIGLEIQINDNITGATREGLVTWNSDACLGWQDTEAMGTIEFVDSPEGYVPPETEPEPETDPVTEKPETEKPETEKPVANETEKPETGKTGPSETKAPAETGPSEGGSLNGLIIGIVIAVVVIVAVIVAVSVIKKKKG